MYQHSYLHSKQSDAAVTVNVPLPQWSQSDGGCTIVILGVGKKSCSIHTPRRKLSLPTHTGHGIRGPSLARVVCVGMYGSV